MTPSFDLRRLKRINGYYSVERAAQRNDDLELCHICGKQPKCSLHREIEALRKRNEAKIEVRRCGYYRPILAFRDRTGLDARNFNTFRLGEAWYNRVREGTICAFGDAKTGEIFGAGRVVRLYKGPFKEMAKWHADMNHMLLHKMGVDAAEEIFRIMRNAHGTMFVTWERTVTVIYMEPHFETP